MKLTNLQQANKLKDRLAFWKKEKDYAEKCNFTIISYNNKISEVLEDAKKLKDNIEELGLAQAQSSEDITNDLKAIKILGKMLK